MLERPISKAGWTRVAFGDVVRKVNDRVDPWNSGLERYVAGEHMDTDDLRIRRWGLIGDDYLGPAFHMRFKPGHVLYGSRRTYLRKVALADFEGITANTTFVLETKDPARVLPELLPFLMQTEAFHSYSIKHSKGSVNPYINFSDLEAFEFLLPPIQEQARLIEIMQAARAAIEALETYRHNCRIVADSILQDAVREIRASGTKLGWSLRKLGDVAEVTKLAGFEYTKHFQYRTDGDVIAIRPTNIKDGRLVLDDIQTIDQETSDKLPRSKVNAGDVLITYIGAYVGEVLHINESDRFHLAPNIARIRSTITLDTQLLERLLRSGFVQEQIQSYTTATAAPSLTMENIRKLKIAFPETRSDQNELLGLINKQDIASDQILKRTSEVKAIFSIALSELEPK